MPGYISQWWDSLTQKYKEVSKEDPFPVTMVGGGTGGAEEVEVTQPLPTGTNTIGKVNLTGNNGDAATNDGAGDDDPQSQIGLLTNARLYGFDGTNWGRIYTQHGNTDGIVATLIGIMTNSRLLGYNGSTWDRLKSVSGVLQVDMATNAEDTALSNAVRTATTNSPDITNSHGKGAIVVLDVTASSGSPSITFKIQGKDAASGKYYDILTSTAVTSVSTTVLKVYPGLTAAANSIANDILPHTWRVVVEHSNADSIDYGVGYSIV